MAQNKLKLYDDNTEAPFICRTEPLFLKRSPPIFVLAVPTFLSRPAFGNLVIWNRITSLNKHISNVCRSTYVEIRRISSVKTTETLVCAFVLFKLDYCHSLLSGCPLYILRRLQKVQIFCRETGFQITQAWSCATSSLSSSFATGPSQNRLQILSYLSQLLLWLAPFFSTLTFSLFTHLPDSFVFCRHTDTSHPQR